MTTSHSDALEKLFAYELHNPDAGLTPLERAAERLVQRACGHDGMWVTGGTRRGSFGIALCNLRSPSHNGTRRAADKQLAAVIAACDCNEASTAWKDSGVEGNRGAAVHLGIDALIDWNAILVEAKNEATAQPALTAEQRAKLQDYLRKAIQAADWRSKHPDAKLTPPEVAAVRAAWPKDRDINFKARTRAGFFETLQYQRTSGWWQDRDLGLAAIAALKAVAERALEQRRDRDGHGVCSPPPFPANMCRDDSAAIDPGGAFIGKLNRD